jgi:uncharacterized Zn finger protein (UPF0148 family)
MEATCLFCGAVLVRDERGVWYCSVCGRDYEGVEALSLPIQYRPVGYETRTP